MLSAKAKHNIISFKNTIYYKNKARADYSAVKFDTNFSNPAENIHTLESAGNVLHDKWSSDWMDLFNLNINSSSL